MDFILHCSWLAIKAGLGTLFIIMGMCLFSLGAYWFSRGLNWMREGDDEL
jgi:uncharacterized membrane protein